MGGFVSQRTGKEWAAAVKEALAAAGMPRTSEYNGGELTGWTTVFGSTGFSLRLTEKGQVEWHVVVSGKPLLAYREYVLPWGRGDEIQRCHSPIDPEKLCPRIKAVFEGLGLVVHAVTYYSH